MELTGLLRDMPLCRLCGEENENGTNLFPTQENAEDLSELVNKYLPLKIENDGKLPAKICPGCNIQLEATKSFMDLIVDGQAKLRHLYKTQQEKFHRQEKQRQQLENVLKSVNPTSSVDTYTIESDETGDKFIIQIFSPGPLFPADHELTLRADGLTQPRRKRGRPPKPPLTIKQITKVTETTPPDRFQDNGQRKRRIKVPTRYLEAIQGKELDKVLELEGVLDEESLLNESKPAAEEAEGPHSKRVEEVIGRMESENGDDLGELVTVHKGPIKPRTKGVKSRTRKRRKYKCEVCAREFLHHGRYELHKESHDVQFACKEDKCDYKTDSRALLAQHQRKNVHVGLVAREKIQQYGTVDLSPVVEARTTLPAIKSPAKKQFVCEKCNKHFTCKQNHEIHVKTVHEGERSFACPHCDKRFSYNNSLKLHLNRHAKPPPEGGATAQYRCPTCSKYFRHPSSLQYHRDAEHADGRRFVCNKCDKPFKHRQLLQRHQLVHSEERPYRCHQCSAAFKTRANLIHHSRTVHSGQRAHWCLTCGKTFVHKTALSHHQRWHEGLRPFECEYCQKTFSQKGNLAEHRRIHTGEKPYQCDQCERAFTTSSQYRLHKKRHFDEKPHKCDLCTKSFLHKVTLKCHMRRHFGDKPYKCEMCPRSFPESWALKKHERLHSGEKPYKCELCARGFADSSNLAKHKRTHKAAKSGGGLLSDKQMLYVTYEKEAGDAIVTYIEPQTPLIPDDDLSGLGEESIDDAIIVQFQQLVDQEGNPISFTTQDGQQVKVVSSGDEGQENIQGLLPDGTLVPISLSTSEVGRKVVVEEKATELPFEGQIPTNIEFLEDEEGDSKLSTNIEFIDPQNMCLVTNYDPINPQFLNIS